MKKRIGKVLRLVGSVVGMLLAVVVGLYLIILAVNWRDRPVGPAAARLEQMVRNEPVIAEADNAYTYLIGLGAVTEHRPSNRDKPRGRYRALSDNCGEFNLACYQALDGNEELVSAWLKEEEWLLEHYLVLLDRRGWQAASPMVLADSLSAVSAGFDGQRMLMQQAWTRAAAGDAAGVRQLLEKDIRFWRMVVASSGDLVIKEIAGWAIHGHFKWANIVLRKLPAERQLQAVPEQWRMPVTLEERSLLRAVAGEQGRVAHVFDYFAASPDRTSDRFHWLMAKLVLPTVQRQDYMNRYSALVTAVSDTLNVSHAAFPAALRQAKGMVHKARADAFDGWAYNLMGNLVMRRTPPDITAFGIRAADLEGTRRTALLTVQLRAEGVDTDQVAARLASAALRDPYSNQPFGWDAKARSVVFTGLEPGARGRHSFLY
jgi:hypothetical protein